MTDPEFSIKQALEEAGTDAYLTTGNLHNSDIFYVTHFLASDEFAYLQTAEGKSQKTGNALTRSPSARWIPAPKFPMLRLPAHVKPLR